FDTVGDGNEEDIITIGSPGDIPYAVASSGNLDSIFSHAMPDENWAKFIDADLTSAQAGTLFAMWRRHYGMGSQGEGDACSAMSRDSATRYRLTSVSA